MRPRSAAEYFRHADATHRRPGRGASSPPTELSLGVDLNALALQIASELAKGDLARASVPTGPQPRAAASSAPATPARGVVFGAGPVRLAELIDHTLRRPDATRADVDALCAEAREHRFAAVRVAPSWVAHCRSLLAGSGVRVATVVGGAGGAARVEVKALEASLAAEDGADEIAVVAPTGRIRGGEWRAVAADVGAVARTASGRVVQVMLDTSALSPAEIVRAAVIARDEGAHHVAAGTGAPGSPGATPAAVALLRLVVGDALGAVAVGPVADAASAFALLASGATRIATPDGVALASAVGPGALPVAELFGPTQSVQPPQVGHSAHAAPPAQAAGAGSAAFQSPLHVISPGGPAGSTPPGAPPTP